MVASSDNSLWLFDLRRPKGHELFRQLRHRQNDDYFGLVQFSGFLPSGELVSFESMVSNRVKIWQSLTSSTSEMNVLQGEEHIKEVKIESDRYLSDAIILNRGGRIAFWGKTAEFITIYDVNRPAGQERIGSIDLPTFCEEPVVTPCGQLLVVCRDAKSSILTVWQLTDNLPVLVRHVDTSQTGCSKVSSLKLIPDGRILAISEDHVGIVDLTKSEGKEMVRTIRRAYA